MLREKPNAQELGRKRSRLLLAGTAVFTLAAQSNHLGNKRSPRPRCTQTSLFIGKDREEKVLVFRPEGWVVV